MIKLTGFCVSTCLKGLIGRFGSKLISDELNDRPRKMLGVGYVGKARIVKQKLARELLKHGALFTFTGCQSAVLI